MTAVDVWDRVGELTDGTGGSVDAVVVAATGPYRKSRLNLRDDGNHCRDTLQNKGIAKCAPRNSLATIS